MGTQATNHGIFYSCYHRVEDAIYNTFSTGESISDYLAPVKAINKVFGSTLAVASYISNIENYIPVSVLQPISKDIKNGVDFFMGFRSFKAIMNGKFARNDKGEFKLKILALNVSGLALMFFTSVSLLGRFKFNVSAITNFTKNVPVLGALPYAGLLNVSLLTMFGTLYLMSEEKIASLKKAAPKLYEKITDWAEPLDQEKIQKKLDHYRDYNKNKPNHLTKLAMWEKISESELDSDEIKSFSQRKFAKWSLKRDKLNLEIHSNKLQKLSCAAKVVATFAVSIAILTGTWVAIAAAVAVCLGVVEAVSGWKNYQAKNELSSNTYKYTPVYL